MIRYPIFKTTSSSSSFIYYINVYNIFGSSTREEQETQSEQSFSPGFADDETTVLDAVVSQENRGECRRTKWFPCHHGRRPIQSI